MMVFVLLNAVQPLYCFPLLKLCELEKKLSHSCCAWTMDIYTENSLPVVCGGLEVIEYESIVESCVVGTVENNKI